jgi:hypothetical protein
MMMSHVLPGHDGIRCNILEEDQSTYQWYLKDDIAKKGELSFGFRGIPAYRRRNN